MRRAVAVLVLAACTPDDHAMVPDPAWTSISPTLAADLSRIAGTASDVWVLGFTDFNARAGVVARWDGTAWTQIDQTGFFHLTAAGDTDIWLAGQMGQLARWDGSTFAPIASGAPAATLGPMFGATGDDLWIVQSGSSSVLHWNGSSVSPVAVGASAINGVSGTARDDVWAVGAAVYHYDGASWTTVPAPNVGALTSVTAITRDLAWAQSSTEILRWDGTSWAPDTGLPASSKIAGRARDDVWAYTAMTTTVPRALRHWDGASWSMDTAPNASLGTVWVDPGGALWFAGDYDRVLRRDACGWRYLSGAIYHSETITGMWASGPDVRMIGAPYGDLYGVGACGLAAVGTLTNDSSNAIDGTSADDLWIVGSYGAIEHFDGTTTTSPTQPTSTLLPTLHGVWARAVDDAWAVGELGRITHWDGQAWTDVPSPTTNWLTAVWGTGASDVWAVGELGTLLHWDGAAWTIDDSHTRAWLGSVWASDDEVWVVGEAGTLLHRRQGAWTAVASGTTATLMTVRGRARDDVWAVGERGTMIHDQGSGWRAVPTPTDRTLTAIGLGDVTWVGGGGALVMVGQ